MTGPAPAIATPQTLAVSVGLAAPAALAVPGPRKEAAALALEARTPNTRRAYRRHLDALNSFLGTCDPANSPDDPRPLDDATLSAWVAHLAGQGKAPASVSQAVAAACFMAKVAGWPNPRGTMTSDALRIVKRDHADRGRGQARPITAEQATSIIATSLRDGRVPDAAITGLLFQGALRRSEVAALTWGDIESAPKVEGALLIRVRRSKTNQDGGTRDVRLVKGTAAEALRRMRPAGAVPTDAVFGCAPRTINRRFIRAAKAAGIEGVSAHSGRAGHASELTARGASTTEVMLSGGWSTARMVAHYAAGAKAEKGAVVKYL